MKPHKHAELIKAWADGAEIQYKYAGIDDDAWDDDDSPLWNENGFEFRIKPEPKPDVEMRYWTKLDCFILEAHKVKLNANLKLTFDGETGELKSAEVLK